LDEPSSDIFRSHVAPRANVINVCDDDSASAPQWRQVHAFLR
jgi:hypothetical protein